MDNIMKVSPLGKTWIFDIDGTIVKHNGYKIDGYDTFLEGAAEFLAGIPDTDAIIFVTSRKEEECGESTRKFLADNNVRYNSIVFDMPYGERILINDRKPSGLEVSVAVNTDRDVFMKTRFEVDENL